VKRAFLVIGLLVWAAFATVGCTSVLELKTGQCFDGGATGSVSSVNTVDCAKEHTNEVFAITQYPAGKADPFPGDEALRDRANADCPPAFQAFVGKPFDQSEFDILFLTPSADTWKSGDRAIVCTLSLPDAAKLTGSMQGSNR
jgi:hypothetical protein